MAEKLWTRIEIGPGVGDYPSQLTADDICFYAQDYYSGQNWQAGPGNDFIINFKKPVCRRGLLEWQHKEREIKKFALHLAKATAAGTGMAPAPTSKTDDHAEYDDRLVRTVELAAQYNTGISIHRPIAIRQTVAPSHAGGTRDPEAIYANFRWLGFNGDPPATLIVVDDVITSGAHYRAYKRMVREHHEGISVIGVFWGKTTKPPPTEFKEIEARPTH
jgi:hypothetical protein